MNALRVWALPVALGLAGVAALSALGIPIPFCWGWGCLIAAVTVLLRIHLPDDPRSDAPGRRREPGFVGSEVSRLAWAIDGRSGTVNEAVTRRVRGILRRRLERFGIDVDDEADAAATERALGGPVWERLTGRRTTIQDIEDALAAAERLRQAAPSAPATNASTLTKAP